ncbi:golvesin C-terminal-like domain-containing protein [Streptomyces sp. JNUCC 64]
MDTSFATSGDATGFHLLVADERDGYAWRTAATLSEPGFDTDTWIGNACLTGSGDRAAVSYAPRTFTNKPELMARGAFTAVVDLTNGEVTKLPFQASLAYFSPGCGVGERAVFTQLPHDGDKSQRSRLVPVDARKGESGAPVAYPGQVTSAVPVRDGIVAAHGNRVVRAERGGELKEVTRTRQVPFQFTVDRDGGLTFIDRTRSAVSGKTSTSYAQHLPPDRLGDGGGKPTTVASGALTDWDLTSSGRGTVFVTGEATSKGTLPGNVENPGGIAKGALVSSHGHAAVTTAWADGEDTRVRASEALGARTVRTTVKLLRTEKTVVLDARPEARGVGGKKALAQGKAVSPALPAPKGEGAASTRGGSGPARSLAAPDDPTEGEAERTCSVPRNDVRKQAFQPTPRQVEWAVNQAVVGKLDFTRETNWKNTGTGGYSPQSLFPGVVLHGDPNGKLDTEDGVSDRWHIPSQILLGITAQESNMWQATRFAVPGVTANSLIGNYYGVDYAPDGAQLDPWKINWADADCGYGITQVTDGMRLPGHGQPTLSPQAQNAVALDYTANIAAGARILSEKWNETRRAGMTVNNGTPQWIENWFFALWAYNSGFYATPDSAGHSGVGWTNNPANPLWKANRVPFLQHATDPSKDDYSHAAQPQHWPYQEKVIGWAARPISAMAAPGNMQPGYRAAWWNSVAFRTTAKPPVDLFCDSSNSCTPSKIGDNDSNDPGLGACTLDSGNGTTNPHWLHCWWNKPVQWKDCDQAAQCGNQVHRFTTTYPEQPDANSYPPRCSSGLPANALIVDDVPNGVTPAGPSARGCGAAKSDGTFGFQFTGWNGTYPGKMDTHQIGAGYQNHFWFTHDRQPETPAANADRMKVTGTWKLGRKVPEDQAKVYAHIPDHGAQVTEATYQIKTALGVESKTISQTANQSNKWVELGVYRFNDALPEVSLSNFTATGNGTKDIAWDAIAFVPGDFDELGTITFPAENPNAPEIDQIAAQVRKDAGLTGAAADSGRSARPSTTQDGTKSCRKAGDGITFCAGYEPDTGPERKRKGKTDASPPGAQRRNPVAAVVSADCRNNALAASFTRTEGCLRGAVPTTVTRNGQLIGTAIFKVIQEVKLLPTKNHFTVSTEISMESMTGLPSTTLTSLEEDCWPTTGCTESVGPWTGSTTWTPGDTHVASRVTTFTWNTVAGGQQTLDLSWKANWHTPVPGIQTASNWSHQKFDVRCDNQVAGNSGCVFSEYTPTMNLNHDAYPAAAAYYYVLMSKLASHPGSESHNSPLTRFASDAEAEENRKKMCTRAVAEWKPHPNASGRSCDEYPFAKSRQSGGMTLTSGKFCVQMYSELLPNGRYMLKLDNNYPVPTWKEICGRAAVPASQNTAAGGTLGNFTKAVRLLDHDKYFVRTGYEGCDLATVCNFP